MFETKRQRGRFLVAVFVVFMLSAIVTDRWASAHVDELARDTRTDLARLLNDATFPDFAIQAERRAAELPSDSAARIDPVTGEVQVATPLSTGWQQRCVEAHRAGTGEVAARVRHGRCRPLVLHP